MVGRVFWAWAGFVGAVLLTGQALAEDRALLIGIDGYGAKSLAPKIEGAAANDVAAMTSLLQSKFGYAKSQIKALLNEAATKDAIVAGIGDWLGDGTKAGERAFFYFAGLGYFEADSGGDEKDGLDEAIVPYDAQVDTGGKAPKLSGLFSDDEFTLALKILEGRNVTIVLDAGFSGSVTRAGDPEGTAFLTARVPQLSGTTRSIVIEPRVKKQKKEAGFVETAFGKGSLAVWSAVSASQVALVDTKAEGGPGGVFTKLYVEGVAQGKADKNENGVISNAELLSYIAEGAETYCSANASVCEMGLTPRLDPGQAHGLEAFSGKTKSKTDPTGKKGEKGKGKLTLDQVTDLLAKGNTDKVVVKQLPPSPVRVGTRNIRFQVISPHDGHLILLDLSDDGKLVQLYPNQFSSKHEVEQSGRLRANSPLTVPDSYYGIRFNATAASKGHILAIVTRDKVDFGTSVTTRAIEVIPREEAAETYLPKIAEALGTPVKGDKSDENTASAGVSVATLGYEILPRDKK